MTTVLKTLVVVWLWAVSAALAAVPGAVVDSVQMPAWVAQADGRTVPLAPGMVLQAGDLVRTGPQSRVLVKLSEGSLVKLGENATLLITWLAPNPQGLFRAALSVAQGAFRFTTQQVAKIHPREVSISVGTATAGIRGTDLWGKAERSNGADQEIVCLIEGKVEVTAAGEPAVVMDQPLQLYQRHQGAAASVGQVAPVQLQMWAQETEITTGVGAARHGGRFSLTLMQSATLGDALALHEQVRRAGYAAQIKPGKQGQTRVYSVGIGNLPSTLEAQALAERLRGQYGIP